MEMSVTASQPMPAILLLQPLYQQRGRYSSLGNKAFLLYRVRKQSRYIRQKNSSEQECLNPICRYTKQYLIKKYHLK